MRSLSESVGARLPGPVRSSYSQPGLDRSNDHSFGYGSLLHRTEEPKPFMGNRYDFRNLFGLSFNDFFLSLPSTRLCSVILPLLQRPS
jgi:hypothetical protein